jgi:hypothetical protein
MSSSSDAATFFQQVVLGVVINVLLVLKVFFVIRKYYREAISKMKNNKGDFIKSVEDVMSNVISKAASINGSDTTPPLTMADLLKGPSSPAKEPDKEPEKEVDTVKKESL